MPKRSKTVMLTLRVPISLRAGLRGAAETDHRSVNSVSLPVLGCFAIRNASASAGRVVVARTARSVNHETRVAGYPGMILA